MESLGLRHAGDTPVEGFIWRKSPFAGPLGGRREACWVGGCGAGGRRQGWEGSGRPTGGRREACWVGGCGAGGRWQGRQRTAARLEGGARPAGVEAAAAPVGGGRAGSERPPDWRVVRGLLGWRRLRRRWAVAGQASRRTEVWRREAAQNSHGQASRAHAELG